MKESIVVCFRVSDKALHHVPSGSLKEKCAACGEEVYISPETMIRRNEINADILCIHCAIEKAKEVGRVSMAAPTKGQIQELQQEIVERKNRIHLN